MKIARYLPFGLVGASLIVACAPAQQTGEEHPELSGVYRGQGLAVQPCGHNEWMLRSFETDEFCFGSLDGFPFTEQGIKNWKSFEPINDPALGCIPTFPRVAMFGGVQLIVGEEITTIAYGPSPEQTRTVHMNGAPPPPDTPYTFMGYSIGYWVGDTLVVETTHTRGGPLFNDYKQSSREAKFTERYWKAPDGKNLLIDLAIDDPVNFTKPFLINRQEKVWVPDGELRPSDCTPVTIWEEKRRELLEENSQ